MTGCRNSVATPMTGCRNSVATPMTSFAQFLAVSIFEHTKLPVREPVLGPNHSHSHSLIRGVHGKYLNGGGNELTTLAIFYVARCNLGVIRCFSANPALSQCGEYCPVFWPKIACQIARRITQSPDGCPVIGLYTGLMIGGPFLSILHLTCIAVFLLGRWFRVLAGFEYWRYIGHAFQFFVLDPLLIGVPVFGAGAGTCFWIPILEPGQAPSFAAGISGDSEGLTEPEGFGESL
jgi:hypothetical protein